MKRFAKLFLLLTAVAVILSAFSLGAYAQEDEIDPSLALEYYENLQYTVLDFEDTDNPYQSADIYEPANDAFTVTEIDGNHVFKIAPPNNVKAVAAEFKVPVGSYTRGIGVSFDFSTDDTQADKPNGGGTVHVVLVTNDLDDDGIQKKYELVTVGTNKNIPGFRRMVNGELVAVEGVSLTAGAWYSLSFHMDYETGKYTATLFDAEGAEVATVTEDAPEFIKADVIRVGTAKRQEYGSVAKTVTMLDNVAVYDGSFIRSVAGDAMQREVEALVIEMMTAYDASTNDVFRQKVTDVMSALVNKYNFTTENEDCMTAMTSFYFVNSLPELESLVTKATYTSYYSAKKSNIEDCKTYRDALSARYPELSKANTEFKRLCGLIDGLEKEIAESNAAATAYIAAVKPLETLVKGSDYAAIKAAVDKANALKEKGNISGIDGVIEANLLLSEAETKINCREGNSRKFITAVDAIETAKTLSERRAAIVTASQSLSDADLTYSGVVAAKEKLTAATADYNAAVRAANAEFRTACGTAATVSAAGAPTGSVGTALATVADIMKKD